MKSRILYAIVNKAKPVINPYDIFDDKTIKQIRIPKTEKIIKVKITECK